MNEEINDNTKENFESASLILVCIFAILNVIFIIISFFLLSSKSKNLKVLKYKLFTLIIMDSVSSLIYSNYRYKMDLFSFELFFSVLSSIEFYLFILFIYQIFISTDISQNAKSIELVSPIHFCVIFLLISFSYHKFSYLYSKLLNVVEYIIILSCIVLLYRYFEDTIASISVHLVIKDIQTRKAYYYLNIANSIALNFLIFNYILKLILIFIDESYHIYFDVALISINYGFKYFVFILFEAIIYTLSKNYYKNNMDEIVGIFQKKNIEAK